MAGQAPPKYTRIIPRGRPKRMFPRHLLSATDLARPDLDALMDLAERMGSVARGETECNLLKGKKLRNLFLEESTRTIHSFEEAFLGLGGIVLQQHRWRPDSPEDMARVVTPSIHCVVIRHPEPGFVQRFASRSSVPVVNAGNGTVEHPTQSLIDLFTILTEFGRHGKRLEGARIALIGDLLYGRTVHSLMITLAGYAKVGFVLAPLGDLAMPDEYIRYAVDCGCTVDSAPDLAAAIEGADVVYMTRHQRHTELTVALQQQAKKLQLTRDTFERHGKRDAVIMHPMPRNTEYDEVATDLDELPNFAMIRQALNGIPVRMALLSALLLGSEAFDAPPRRHQRSEQPCLTETGCSHESRHSPGKSPRRLSSAPALGQFSPAAVVPQLGQTMLTTDQLNGLAIDLETACLHADGTAAELRAFFDAILDSAGYRDWNDRGQFDLEFPARTAPRLPDGLDDALGEQSKHILEKYLVTENRRLTIKIDRFFGQPHLSDGFWVDPQVRVYPTGDESDILCRYITTRGYDRAADILLDPACGSGRHAVALDVAEKASLDISARALAYCVINGVLAGSNRQVVAMNDIRCGFPDGFSSRLRGNVLVAANLPFGLYPRLDHTPLAQDGGARGSDLTFAALDAIATLWRTAPGISNIQAVVLYSSLGRSGNGPWEIEQALIRWPEFAEVKCALLPNQRIWRINGRKEQPNPMPLESLEERATCRFTWPRAEEPSVRQAYRTLQKDLEAEGWTHLGFGLLDLHLTR